MGARAVAKEQPVRRQSSYVLHVGRCRRKPWPYPPPTRGESHRTSDDNYADHWERRGQDGKSLGLSRYPYAREYGRRVRGLKRTLSEGLVNNQEAPSSLGISACSVRT